MRRVVIVGAAGQGREAAAVVREAAAAGAGPAEIVFVDDDPALHGRLVDGSPVIGDLTTLAAQDPGSAGVLGVGMPHVKARVVQRLDTAPWVTVAHPRAICGNDAVIGTGVLLQAGAVLTVAVRLEDFVTVNIGATISHDCTVGRFATISPGARLAGAVQVGEGAFVGIGATVVQGVRIGAWSTIGAGAVVLHDVPDNAVVAGVPARVIDVRAPGWPTAVPSA